MTMEPETKPSPNIGNRWQDWCNLILAVWLFISPWIFQTVGKSVAASWDAWIFGVVVGALSLAALARNQAWEEWINLLSGAWVFVSPWVLGFAGMTAMLWNFLIVGALILILGVWDLVTISAPRSPMAQH